MKFQVELRIYRPDDAGGHKVSWTIVELAPGLSFQPVWWDDEFPDAGTAEEKGRALIRAHMREKYKAEPEDYELKVRRGEEA